MTDSTAAKLAMERAVTAFNDMEHALRAIMAARDHHAEHGHYPPGLMQPDQCFDDWAADLAAGCLAMA